MKLQTSRQIITFLIVIALLYSCNEQKRDAPITKSDEHIEDSGYLSKGFNLLQNSCFSCHNPNPLIDEGIAPSMKEIKINYVKEGTSLEQFQTDLAVFLNNPSEEKSIIPNAVNKYGVMPNMNLNEDEIKQIALYIYTSELANSNWFENQYPEDKKRYNSAKNQENISPVELGKKIAMQTKSVLGSNLKQAISNKGTEEAVSFCSTRAIALTDSMAVQLNAKIKRVSDKNRNPGNRATTSELSYINKVKELIESYKEVEPGYIETETTHKIYLPIITNAMCLQCHGIPYKEVKQNVYSKITDLYPNDKATGYKTDELRGIWVVEFDKK